MRSKLVHYFLPLFLVFYFTLAFIPIFRMQTVEIFPFFSFKLYSKIPNGFVHYDMLLNKGEDDEKYLLFGNKALNKLERKNYFRLVGRLGQAQEVGALNSIDLSQSGVLDKGESVYLIKITGDYISAIRDNSFDVEIIEKLK